MLGANRASSATLRSRMEAWDPRTRHTEAVETEGRAEGKVIGTATSAAAKLTTLLGVTNASSAARRKTERT